MIKQRKLLRSNQPATVQVGCALIQAADNCDKTAKGPLNVLAMVRDTTVRFNRLKSIGVKISGLTCGL